ncbi:FtsX-like permease family protein [Subsaximicrobium wynnwilliamsii]|uniref:FtsX-like permease family protein n=1 Tax=Subsaximicrobium wynnwilliamsii TaxID=291179 RepID=A0A5C6ZFA9_9FLAO|nr:ABC transporter permease [Subsaximicrobium wynnwilliamsii]TXD83185.1 FtsX-like permease family protein [Subsaximicrobium wynnwilliamsii]TXD88298.1 FtsX-like permease family protein [Subsaximicrobium wynnwilliamsii]TXE03019.1 FtsX-like permease family protein [Subsaximicrobium wynnwilliamsii]
MIRNYIKIAFRNLKKNKVYSFINIFGLALGLAVTMIIGLWIVDEFNYNDHFESKDQIAQVMQNQTINGSVETNEGLPLALEFQLRDHFGDAFESIVMSSRPDERYLSLKDKVISSSGRFMQVDAPDLLELDMLEGTRKGLKETNAILLSETTAQTLFGSESPLGKSIVSDNEHTMVVTGIYKDIYKNNSFNGMHFIMPFKHWMSTRWGWLENQDSNWSYNPFFIYVKFSENADLAAVNARIVNLKKDNLPVGDVFNSQLFLFPMADWYLHSNFENGKQVGGRIENVWLFGIIGLFVLLLASINFMNLSTARSEKRALEVGIRKSIGSTRRQLIYQFLSESFLVVLVAFILAIGLVLVSLPAFNTIAGKDVIFPWSSSLFWMVSLGFIGFTALVSGSYPALYLSSFKPIKVLKGTFKMGKFAALPRKVLVVTQFTVSIALIIGTLIVKDQIDYSKNRPVGINSAQLIQLPTSSQDFSGKYDLIRNAFLSSGSVAKMGWGTSPATSIWNYSSGFEWDGKPVDFNESFAQMAISFDYIDAVGMKIIEGRSFSRDFATDSNAVVLNKTAVDYMGIKNPVGKYIRGTAAGPNDVPMQIVGVVEDVINESAYEPVSPQMYQFGHGTGGFYYLRLNPNQATSKSLASVEKIFKTNFPNLPFSYDFVDEEYAQTFAAEERIASLAKVFTLLAILISCLGLFGLASFMAEQRKKEIGVRKVLGATVTNLWLLLSKDFILLIAISICIAAPLAYYFMSDWIEKFFYRTDISIGVFLIAGLGALLLTVITVSFQAIKAAIANPVKSLRTE